MKFRRIITMLLVVLSLTSALVLTGCKSNDNNDATPSSTSTTDKNVDF